MQVGFARNGSCCLLGRFSIPNIVCTVMPMNFGILPNIKDQVYSSTTKIPTIATSTLIVSRRLINFSSSAWYSALRFTTQQFLMWHFRHLLSRSCLRPRQRTTVRLHLLLVFLRATPLKTSRNLGRHLPKASGRCSSSRAMSKRLTAEISSLSSIATARRCRFHYVLAGKRGQSPTAIGENSLTYTSSTCWTRQ